MSAPRKELIECLLHQGLLREARLERHPPQIVPSHPRIVAATIKPGPGSRGRSAAQQLVQRNGADVRHRKRLDAIHCLGQAA